MLRDKNLIPLSHQHQRALALCVRIDRAQPIPEKDLDAWQEEIDQHFRQEIDFHFSAEESALFPPAFQCDEVLSLVEAMRAENAALRKSFSEVATRRMSLDSVVPSASK